MFLDACLHLYKRVCPSVGSSVRQSVRPSVLLSRVISKVKNAHSRRILCRVSGLVSFSPSGRPWSRGEGGFPQTRPTTPPNPISAVCRHEVMVVSLSLPSPHPITAVCIHEMMVVSLSLPSSLSSTSRRREGESEEVDVRVFIFIAN